MAPATCLSQLIVLVVAAPFAHPGEADARDLALLVALGVGQIGLGLVFLTIGGRLIPAAEVALITLLEIVLGPLWVWIALGEQPSAATLAGGAVVLAAVAIQARGEPAVPASLARVGRCAGRGAAPVAPLEQAAGPDPLLEVLRLLAQHAPVLELDPRVLASDPSSRASRCACCGGPGPCRARTRSPPRRAPTGRASTGGP